jgi:hypothetical protein
MAAQGDRVEPLANPTRIESRCPMRRVLFALLSAMAIMIAAAAPALAAKPEHSREGPADPIELPAGEICDFNVTLSSPVNTSTTSVWEYPDGTQRILNRGYAAGTVTNTDDGISATHNGGFRSEVVIHPDGSVDVSVRGTFFAWYLEGDPVVGLSDGLFAVHGNGSESYGPDGTFTGAVFKGQSTDLCEVLAPTN